MLSTLSATTLANGTGTPLPINLNFLVRDISL